MLARLTRFRRRFSPKKKSRAASSFSRSRKKISRAKKTFPQKRSRADCGAVTDWSVRTIARNCAVCGNAFADGDEVVSLAVKQPDGSLVRVDIAPECLAKFELSGELLGQWRRRFAQNVSERERFRQSTAGKEAFFFSLFESETAGTAAAGTERESLKQLFALLLERARLLRRVGRPIRGVQKFVHPATGRAFDVPAGTLQPENLTTFENLLEMLE